MLAEFDGLRKPNRYGEVPFKNLDPLQPNEKYFEVIDSTVKLALSKNMYMGLLPTWGDKITPHWGDGPLFLMQTMRINTDGGLQNATQNIRTSYVFSAATVLR